MAVDSDTIFEKAVIRLAPIWGPFYAFFYITRFLWREFLRRREEE